MEALTTNHTNHTNETNMVKCDFVGRGSRDPARVPDRRSPTFGACSDGANAFEARPYGELWRS